MRNSPKLRAPGPQSFVPRREPRSGFRSSHARRHLRTARRPLFPSKVHAQRTEAQKNATGRSRPRGLLNSSCQISGRRWRTCFRAWKSRHSPGAQRSRHPNGKREEQMPGAHRNLPQGAQPSHRGSLRLLHGNHHRRRRETRLHRPHGSLHHRPYDHRHHRRRAGQKRVWPRGQTKLRMLTWEVLRVDSTY